MNEANMSNVERLMALADEYARHAALQGMAIGADSSKAEMAADMEDASRAALQSAIERLAAPAEPVVTVRDVLQLADDSLHDLHAQMDPDDFHDERVQIETARHFIAQAMSAHPAPHPAQPADAQADALDAARWRIVIDQMPPEQIRALAEASINDWNAAADAMIAAAKEAP